MKMVIGLGNPGSQYERTRHNVGFRVVDALASKHQWRWERRNRAMIASGNLGAEKVILVKPITFMNNSGEAVNELVRWFKVQPADIIVVYDELDLPLGTVRLRANGSAGGHNGIGNIIQHLHTNQFPRLRVGIGRPANNRTETIHYVLGIPSGDDQITLATAEDRALAAIPLLLEQGLDTAMNIINIDPEAQKKAEEKRRLQLERREQERLRKATEAARREQENTSDNQEDEPYKPADHSQ